MNPELVVSMLCMESMEDNEAIIVKVHDSQQPLSPSLDSNLAA